MINDVKIPFIKMHGLGNDFVIVNQNDLPDTFCSQDVVMLSDRHRRIGCDQFIILDRPVNSNATIFMRIYNHDGGEVEACGNATRCVVKLTGHDECVIETVAGLLKATVDANTISVNMGKAKTNWADIPLSKEYAWNDIPDFGPGLPRGYVVNVGNPHVVFIVNDVDDIDIVEQGAYIERHPLFPKGVNVEFVQILDDKNVRMRVWERGVGVTQACGSGACAVGYVLFAENLIVRRDVNIHLDGGVLNISRKGDDIIMSGGATLV